MEFNPIYAKLFNIASQGERRPEREIQMPNTDSVFGQYLQRKQQELEDQLRILPMLKREDLEATPKEAPVWGGFADPNRSRGILTPPFNPEPEGWLRRIQTPPYNPNTGKTIEMH